MGLLEYIERARKAPLSERRQIAATLTVVVVVLVVIIWAGFLIIRFSAFSSDTGTQKTPYNPGIESPY